MRRHSNHPLLEPVALVLLSILLVAIHNISTQDKPVRTAAQPSQITQPATSPASAGVILRATPAPHRPGADQYVTGKFTCVSLTITNHTDGQVLAGVEYTTVTGTDGTKRIPTVNSDSREMATVTLTPGENAKGTACAEGTFVPDWVTFENGADIVRARVSG